MPSRLPSALPFTTTVLLTIISLLWAPGTAWGQPGQEAIQLADNTEKGAVVSESVLSPTQQQRHYGVGGGNGVLAGQRTYSLLQSPASRYFSLDSRKGQLRTAVPVDRDLLCPEAGLCCQTSLLPDYRSCAGSYFGGAAVAGPLGGSDGKAAASQTQVCSFNLSVSVVSAEGQQPTVYDVPVYVCEENDHAPEFKVPLSSSGKSANSWTRYDSPSSQQSRTTPVHVVEVSESVSVGHRIRLPTAEDIDAPPFNVQRYELADVSNSFDASLLSSKAYFKLETVHETGSVELGHPLHNNQLAYLQGSRITGLELVVLQTLDREKTPSHQLTVLAVDGGQPARTGTLRVQLTVLDANDHVPVFSRPVYEATVDEGEAAVFNTRFILQVNATDQDEGDNARILYDWSEPAGAGPPLTVADETGLTREAMAAAPPSFWFRLDNRTGAIYLRRPLDYELKRQHRFQLLAYNPPVTGDRRVPGRASHALSSATTNVIIQVHNLDDEPPLIVIDYVNGNQRQFKEIKENLPSPYFVAFITVNDPDLSGSPALMLPTNHRVDSAGGPSVNCQLDSHQESYRLERQEQASLAASSVAYADLHWPAISPLSGAGGGGSKVRFTLSTRQPLDREHKDENHILIRCWDSGIPPKTATAVVRVKILDENDCQPTVKVFATPTGASGTMSRGGGSLGPSAAPIEPWSKEKLHQWTTENYESNGWWPSPLLLAYLANVRAYTLHVSENQPAGTVVARIQAIDRDAGENGRVTFDMPPSTSGLALPLVNEPSSIEALRDYGQTFDDVGRTVKLYNSQKSLEYFKLHPNTGELSILQEIDREDTVSDEDGSQMLEQLFLFIKATDHGSPEAKFTVLLLQIRITDMNDNAPIFCNPEMQFEVPENLPAPIIVGEVLLWDRDIHSHGCNVLADQAGPPLLPSTSGNPAAVGLPSGGLRAPRKPVCSQLTLRIDPGHGRHSLPFVVHCYKEGRFFINTTQALDRESEAVFKFNLIATDADSRHTHRITREHMPVHSVTATVIVTVLDANDNKPEIIFPGPATSNSTTHRVSCRESPGYEIIHVNAQDRDATESNRKLSFELTPEIPGEDLFTIDRVLGVLRTRRQLTKDDMGEHHVRVVVRDEGAPSLQSHVNIRLVVDDSPPGYAHGHRGAGGVSSSRGTEDIPSYFPATGPQGSLVGGGEAGRRGYPSPDRFGQHANYHPGGQMGSPSSAELTNIILVTIMILILILLIVMVGLCFYLRHKRNIFQFLPDLCGLCLLVPSDGGRSSGDEKAGTIEEAAVAGRRSKKKLQANGTISAGELDPRQGRRENSNEAVHLINGDCNRGGGGKHLPDGGELMTSLLGDPSISCGGGGCLSQSLSPSHMLASQMSMQQHDFYAGFNGNGSGYPLLGSTLTADCCDPRGPTVICSPLPPGESTVFSPMLGVRPSVGRFPSSMTTMATPVDASVSPGMLSNSVYHHRPGTVSGVRIPDVADQAEMMTQQKKYVDYCRSMQSSSDAAQSSHNRCTVRPLCDVPPGYHTSPGHASSRQAYNMGLQQSVHIGPQQPFLPVHHAIPRSSDAFYFNAGNRPFVLTNTGFLSPVFGQTQQQQQHGFPVDPSHEMSFRPIRDEPHMYQRIDPCDMYSTGKLHPNAFGEEQMSRRQTMATGQQPHHHHQQQHNKISLLSPRGEAAMMMVGHTNQHHHHHQNHERQPSNGDLSTVLWHSDPSLCNQPVPARLPSGANESEKDLTAVDSGFSGQARQTLCSVSPPLLLLDESPGHNNHHQRHHHQQQEQAQRQQQQKRKRSKSMQRHRPQPPPIANGTKTNANGSSNTGVTAAYYSLLHQPPTLATDPRQGHRHHQQHHNWHEEQEEEDLDTLPLVDLREEDGTSGRESGTTESPDTGDGDAGGAGMTVDVAAIDDDEEQSGAANTEKYAVSYPKVQASFV